jgi:deoxyribodipyrimidine photo-lyase
MSSTVFWFRNDLRLHDNEALLRAYKRGNVTPVYIIDERWLKDFSQGFPKVGAFRMQFILESVQNLRQQLLQINSNLLVRVGRPEEILPQLADSLGASHVVASKEVTEEETDVETALSQALKPLNIDIDLVWTRSLYHALDLPFQIHFLPDIFTEFRKRMERGAKIRATFPAPSSIGDFPADLDMGEIPSLESLGYAPIQKDTRGVLDFKGGEEEGLKRLRYYLWDTQLLKTYKETRNGLLGGDYSSKFSPWLALGCLSPRKIYEEIRQFEAKHGANDSTYWLIFELLWRDYFIFVSLKYGSRMFKIQGIKLDVSKTWKQDISKFTKWINGETGVPFIDANMKELKQTGFMSNRGRQNVASFLAHDLEIDWRWGARYFESQLLDYDVCSNWANWNYVAGIGNDPRENRYFNVVKQGKMYDSKGKYVKHWIPELQKMNDSMIHTPYLAHESDLKAAGVEIGKNYPRPLVRVLPPR